MQAYYTHSPESICQSLERWSSWTHQDIESDKSIIDTVNALVVVAAFIAGVQSQIITFTIQLSRTSPTGRAANVTAFLGLLLDVIGTFLGVIHAIVLQRRIKDNTALLNAMSEISSSLRSINYTNNNTTTPTTDITNTTTAGTAPTLDKHDYRHPLREKSIIEIPDDPHLLLQKAQQLHSMLSSRFKTRTVSGGPFSIALGVLHAFISPTSLDKEKLEVMFKSLFALGHTPLFAMAVGVIALVVSVVLFAAGSDALNDEVWISCVSTLGGVIGLSLLPITYEKAKSYFSRSDLPG